MVLTPNLDLIMMSIQPHAPTELTLLKTLDDLETQPDSTVTFTLLPDDRVPPRYTIGANKQFSIHVKNNDIIISPTYFQGTIKQFIPQITPTPVRRSPIGSAIVFPTSTPTATPTTVGPAPRPTATPFVPPPRELERTPKQDKKPGTSIIDWLPIPLPERITLNLWIAIALLPAILLALYLAAKRTYYAVRDWRIRRSLRRRALLAQNQAGDAPID